MKNKENKLGLKENWKQFTLLVLVNAFVGGMIGLERSIFPQFAHEIFGIESKSAILSFITAFGITKALTNYFAGRLANKYGRRNLLLLGWLMAIPIPFILMNAQHWNLVITANMLLGISQGLTWSSTVVMKIDLVGEKDRGFAMGLNEFAGYVAVGFVAFLSGYVAQKYGITPYPFYLGIIISFIGFLISFLWVKDTRNHVQQETINNHIQSLKNIFWEISFKHKYLSSITQAGLVNNLNDGMIWGLLPIILISMQYDAAKIGIITAIYPIVWGIGQLFTGRMSDFYSKKSMLFWGMLLQGIAILLIPMSNSFLMLAILSSLLGLGTALVYPTFLSGIAQATNPQQRAESIGIFRLWRDLGYAFGAILSGVIADLFGIHMAIYFIGGLTIISSLIIKIRMPNSVSLYLNCIEIDEIKRALLKNGKIKILDVRSKEEFDQGHIPEAIHLSIDTILEHLPALDRNYQYITVCGKGGGRSAEAAKLLSDYNFKTNWTCGGTFGWLKTVS